MCPFCVSTFALIAAGAGTGGLATLAVSRVLRKPAAQTPEVDGTTPLPENEEETP